MGFQTISERPAFLPMPLSELPSLLRLVDDPSPRIAGKVAARLAELGDEVWNEIEEQHIALSPSQRLALQLALYPSPLATFIEPRGRKATEQLREIWAFLGATRDEIKFLEGALWALSSWLRGEEPKTRGEELLDEWADLFRASGEEPDAPSLAKFLFGSGALRGAEASEFHDPRSSDLLWVLEEGAGLPITLSCLFILVGARVGIEIEGCNFPGHFLVRDGEKRRVFDPFNGGRMLGVREVALLRQAAPLEMSERASSRQIIARVLRNLSVAFHSSGEPHEAAIMLSLLQTLSDH